MGSLLAGLFVELTAKDSSLTKSLSGVRDQLADLSSVGVTAGSNAASGFGAEIAPGMAAAMRVAMSEAMKPMQQIGQQMVSQFDAVGGTMIQLSRRIDAHMKFEAFQAAMKSAPGMLGTALNRMIPMAAKVDKALKFTQFEGTLKGLQAKVAAPFVKGAIDAILWIGKIKKQLGSVGDVAGKGMGKLGILPVSRQVTNSYTKLILNITGVKHAAQATNHAVKSLHSSLLMTVGASSAIGALAMFFRKAITGASDFNETANKTEVIFDDQAKVVMKAADEMALKYGVVKTEYLDMASQYGMMLEGMGGKTKEEAAKMSATLTDMTGDAMSIFNGKTFSDIGTKIAAGLRGESEPVMSLGVNVQEDVVAQEALRMGLVKTTKALTMQQKVAARYSLIMKGLKVAQGDLEATQGGFANQSRQAWGRITNTLNAVGGAFLPVVERFMAGFNRMLRGAESWVNGNKVMFSGWAESAASAFDWVKWAAGEVGVAIAALTTRIQGELAVQTGTVSALGSFWEWLKGNIVGSIETIGIAFRNWSLIGEYTGVMIVEKMTNIGEYVQWLGGVFTTFANYLGQNWVSLIGDAVVAVWTILENLGRNIGHLFTAAWDAVQGKGFHFDFVPLLKGFESASAKFPEIAAPHLTKMTDQLADITDRMGANEAKRIADNVKAAQDAKNKPPDADAIAKAKRQGIEADAAVGGGSKEKAHTTDLASYFKSLQEGIFTKNGPAERTAKASEATVKKLDKLIAKNDPIQPGFAVGIAGMG